MKKVEIGWLVCSLLNRRSHQRLTEGFERNFASGKAKSKWRFVFFTKTELLILSHPFTKNLINHRQDLLSLHNYDLYLSHALKCSKTTQEDEYKNIETTFNFLFPLKGNLWSESTSIEVGE